MMNLNELNEANVISLGLLTVIALNCDISLALEPAVVTPHLTILLYLPNSTS